MSAPDPAEIADEWTRRHPIGTRVLYWPGAPDGRGRYSRTRTGAHVLHGRPVVVVDGYPGVVALTHIRVRDDGAPDPLLKQVEDLSSAEQHLALTWLLNNHPDAVASALRYVHRIRVLDERAATPKETTR